MLTPVYPVDEGRSLRFSSIGHKSIEEIKTTQDEKSKGHALGIIGDVGGRKEGFETTKEIANKWFAGFGYDSAVPSIAFRRRIMRTNVQQIFTTLRDERRDLMARKAEKKRAEENML
ncbi:MAG: hypothetical protein Q9216_000378 [Gyalolechia sp. 2 TL-2023]